APRGGGSDGQQLRPRGRGVVRVRRRGGEGRAGRGASGAPGRRGPAGGTQRTPWTLANAGGEGVADVLHTGAGQRGGGGAHARARPGADRAGQGCEGCDRAADRGLERPEGGKKGIRKAGRGAGEAKCRIPPSERALLRYSE